MTKNPDFEKDSLNPVIKIIVVQMAKITPRPAIPVEI